MIMIGGKGGRRVRGSLRLMCWGYIPGVSRRDQQRETSGGSDRHEDRKGKFNQANKEVCRQS